MSYLDLSITEIHQAYLDGKITPLDLVKEAIERAKSDTNNAFEFICEDYALEQVNNLGTIEENNPLWGIPYVLKDNYSTKGIPTTGSSNILKGYVPLFDATVKAKLDAKKCILIGKTTLDELAMGGNGKTGHLGFTYNPYDLTHTYQVGGSSCGSAAATAACIVPFALGSDTGDSVRKPASLAGLVGFKPSWGRISRYGLFPFAPSLDHVAFFTRNVKDNAIILEALAGYDENDATSSQKDVKKYSDVSLETKSLKVAVIKDVIDTVKDPVVLEKFNKGIEQLKNNGIIVEEVTFGKDLLEAILPTYFVISCAEATSNNANLDGIKFGPYHEGNTYQEVMSKARTEGFGELIRRRFVLGSFSLMSENQKELFVRAQKARAKIVERANEIFRDYDFILATAAPSIAPKFESAVDQLSSEYLIADNHLALGNFGGFPSLTLPLGLESGMPLGINFTGKPFEEDKVLAIAKKFEEISGLANLSVYNKKEGNL